MNKLLVDFDRTQASTLVQMEVNVLGAKPAPKPEMTEYATRPDFCRIFASDMKGLYLLSFLLTGDHPMAEQCFVGGLEDSTRGSAVFREWARSWARRKIIENAIRMLRPQPIGGDSSDGGFHNGDACGLDERTEIGAVVALPVFERFVFVISVLEGYSAKNCSLLLGCTRADVIAARTRALGNLATSAELRRESLLRQKPESDCVVGHRFRAISTLAISA